jgi:hypothetical protein
MYMTAVPLKRLISDYRGCSKAWPPTAPDLKLQSDKQEIPTFLYNFLACITGSSDGVLHEGFVETSSENDRKLVSIAQGILYLSSKEG